MEALSTTTDRDKAMLEAARTARGHAFAPYSKFRVGAAVMTENQKIFSGCNVENASYGLSLCAERVAIFSAIASGGRRIESLAVTIGSHTKKPIRMNMPCGACRQVMAEFMFPESTIIIDHVGIFTLEELLPMPFLLMVT